MDNWVSFNFTNFTDGILWWNETYTYFLPGEKEALSIRVIKIVAYCLLFLVSLFGNISVILAVSRDNRLKSTTNILVANMAVSDIILTLLEIPKKISNIIRAHEKTWLVHGGLGQALCKLLPYLADVSFAISLYSCIFIAIDRYYAVAHPFKGGFSRSRLKYIIPGIWLFTAVLCSPFLYSYKLVKIMDELYCSEEWSNGDVATMFKIHLILFIVLTTFLPILFGTILYLLIVYKIRRYKVPGVCTEQSERTRRDRQNQNVLRMSVTIITLLSVCWLFFEILNILETFTNVMNNLSPSVRQTLLFISNFFLLTTCTHQFFLFLIFVDIYRQNFKMMLKSCVCGWRRFVRIHPAQVDSTNSTELV
ncbi:putative neuropeptide Y receptor type 6 [Actinia tenebrosa]|uniref:Neuropeptide Y receptor type 6 n=1 Tax=Actinia tenebrosa TaxID=6105 RepID=A0A6P8HGR6_ACTTE|nr:putative neuropeptide Y receptor type 6 [Actinia tenebrosa]